MERDVLLDTGPLVAVLDARDQWHAQCAGAWPALIARCATTEAVVTEACYLVMRGGASANLPLEFLLRAGIPIVGLPTRGHERASALMARFESLPMDYADSTLVALAEALELTTVFTLDRRGFTTYRNGRKRFAIVPA
ncbi:MAG TPA: PIN domain-containing protein [Gemmatimonadaceae bacterium]|jgi:hypothetical protein|nr:PIN domain-containing protein [Gemmatimonadaceae bacterium]